RLYTSPQFVKPSRAIHREIAAHLLEYNQTVSAVLPLTDDQTDAASSFQYHYSSRAAESSQGHTGYALLDAALQPIYYCRENTLSAAQAQHEWYDLPLPIYCAGSHNAISD